MPLNAFKCLCIQGCGWNSTNKQTNNFIFYNCAYRIKLFHIEPECVASFYLSETSCNLPLTTSCPSPAGSAVPAGWLCHFSVNLKALWEGWQRAYEGPHHWLDPDVKPSLCGCVRSPISPVSHQPPNIRVNELQKLGHSSLLHREC